MDSKADAAHRFETLDLNENGISIAEELLKGVISKIGGDIFQSFLDGIGFPDKRPINLWVKQRRARFLRYLLLKR